MIPQPSLSEIPYGSAEYYEVLTHRDRILRRPLGLILTDIDCENEAEQRHFVLHQGDRLLAGVIAHMDTAESIRLRQMWVDESSQGQGLGKQLLHRVEAHLLPEGFHHFALHARLHVRAFYQACGYQADGPIFEEIGIPHIRMIRSHQTTQPHEPSS